MQTAREIWELFKEIIWRSLWGKAVSMLSLLGTAQTLISLFKPDYIITITNQVKLDYKFWFIFTIIFLIIMLILALRGAASYKRLLEAKGHMTIIFTKNILPYREVIGVTEHYRVGIRVLGKEIVRDPEIVPKKFIKIRRGRLPKDVKYTKIQIPTVALKPMTSTNIIHSGMTVTYFVNVFEHILRHPEIQFRYDYNVSPNPIRLDSDAEYKIEIMARGQHNEIAFASLVLQLDKNKQLEVSLLEDGEK